MKFYTAVSFFIICTSLWAEISILPKKKRYGGRRIVTSKKRPKRDLDKLLKLRVENPLFVDQSYKVPRGRYIPGILHFSVLSTKIGSPVKVMLLPNDYFPENTEIECEGISQDKAVDIYCNMILGENVEYPIKARLLNADGSAGIRGHFYTGKEEYITGIIASEFAKGFLSVAQSKVSTPFGGVADNSIQNQLLQGAANTSNELSNIMKDEMVSKEPKVFVPRGTKVLVYFLETFKGRPHE